MTTFLDLPLELIYIISNKTNNSLRLSLTCKLINSAKLLRNKFFLQNSELDAEYVISLDISLINVNKLRGLRYLNKFSNLLLSGVYNNLEHLNVSSWNNNFDMFPNLEYLKIDTYNRNLVMPSKLKKFICKYLVCDDIVFSNVLTELDISFGKKITTNFVFPNTLLHLKLNYFFTKYLILPNNLLSLTVNNFYGKNIDFNSKIQEFSIYGGRHTLPPNIISLCPNTLKKLSVDYIHTPIFLPTNLTHLDCKKGLCKIKNPNKLKNLKSISLKKEPNFQIYWKLADDFDLESKQYDYFWYNHDYLTNNTNKVIITNDKIIIHITISSFDDCIDDKRTYLSNFYRKYIIMEYNEKEHLFTKTKIHNKKWIESFDFREHIEAGGLKLSEIPRCNSEEDFYRFIKLAYKIPDFDTPEEYGKYVYDLDILNKNIELINGKQYIIPRYFDFNELRKPIEHFSEEQVKESLENSIFLKKVGELTQDFYINELKKIY